MVFFSEVVLRRHELRVEPGRLAAASSGVDLKKRPRADVLVAVLHALLPVRAVRATGAMRHFGVPSAFITGRPGLVMSAVKAVYQKICCAICALAGTGPASEKVMPVASGGAYFFIQSMYLVSA